MKYDFLILLPRAQMKALCEGFTEVSTTHSVEGYFTTALQRTTFLSVLKILTCRMKKPIGKLYYFNFRLTREQIRLLVRVEGEMFRKFKEVRQQPEAKKDLWDHVLDVEAPEVEKERQLAFHAAAQDMFQQVDAQVEACGGHDAWDGFKNGGASRSRQTMR